MMNNNVKFIEGFGKLALSSVLVTLLGERVCVCTVCICKCMIYVYVGIYVHRYLCSCTCMYRHVYLRKADNAGII